MSGPPVPVWVIDLTAARPVPTMCMATIGLVTAVLAERLGVTGWARRVDVKNIHESRAAAIASWCHAAELRAVEHERCAAELRAVVATAMEAP
jgi:hypothetical protein